MAAAAAAAAANISDDRWIRDLVILFHWSTPTNFHLHGPMSLGSYAELSILRCNMQHDPQ